MFKKQFALIFIIVGCVTQSLGQTNKVDIGLEGGPGISTLWGNDYLMDNSQPMIGFSGALSIQYNLPKFFSVRTNLAYERKGSMSKITAFDQFGNVSGDITTRNNYDYITVPLLFRMNFGSKIKFFVNAGPYVGYLIKQTFVTESFNGYPELVSDNIENDKRIDFGISAGIGASFPINENLLFTLELRNNLGLYNVSAVPVVNDGTIQTNSTNLLLGFAYRIGKRVQE